MNNKSELSFVTEIGTFGDMPMKDPTVQSVEKRKSEMTELMESTDNADLKQFLKTQLSK